MKRKRRRVLKNMTAVLALSDLATPIMQADPTMTLEAFMEQVTAQLHVAIPEEKFKLQLYVKATSIIMHYELVEASQAHNYYGILRERIMSTDGTYDAEQAQLHLMEQDKVWLSLPGVEKALSFLRKEIHLWEEEAAKTVGGPCYDLP